MFPTLSLVTSSVKAKDTALSYRIFCGQTMIVLYSLLLYWCPSLWELKGTVLTDETRKNSVEAGWHLLYTKEQLQKQRRIERQWGYFRCSGFETQGTKALGTRCEFSFEKLSSGGETLGKCFFNKRPCFYIFFLLCFWSIPALNSSFWDRLPASIICVPVCKHCSSGQWPPV